MLNPGDTRIVLTWGAKPKDLDVYLTVPHSDPAKDDCVINYKKKVLISVVFINHFPVYSAAASLLHTGHAPVCSRFEVGVCKLVAGTRGPHLRNT